MASSAVPQILTRSNVPLLSEGLDAGDILECYALVRKATVHNSLMSDATMTIHKVALGLRYRPLTVNDPTDEEKIREITLEYGPQRMGVGLNQESMPTVQQENAAGGGDVVDFNSTSSKSFVTWENEGKVYYTTQIASTGYISAYYMASVTGTVLGKILDKAVEYPMENAYIRGRPRRYQPFVVVDGNAGLPPPGFEGEYMPKPSQRKVLLRSSSSVDFMEYMFYTLAELGVSLHPILAPPAYEIQLFATGVEKVKVGPPVWVTQAAATFYEKLYQCIEAKVTGDYTGFTKQPTPSPTTISPTTANPAASLAPSISDQVVDVEPEPTFETNGTESSIEVGYDSNDNDRQRSLRADFPGTPQVMETDPPIDALKDIENLIDDADGTAVNATAVPTVNQTAIHASQASDETGSLALPSESSIASINGSYIISNLTTPDVTAINGTNLNISFPPSISSSPSAFPTNDVPSASPSMIPTAVKVNKQDTKSEVDEAQEAADQAKQAAAEAKDAAKTDVDTKAADAAQAAANAAQKAADATSNAAAQAAMEALLSGDGSTMISFISPCFSDPQFGIAVQGENGTLISQAYLYLDGSSYYKVNLTYPFMQVVPVEHTLPQPRDFASSGSGGDLLDWTLALSLLFMFLFGILMLVQQIFGGYVKLIRPLFNFQIWFFNPLHYEDIKDSMEEERRLTESQQGRGQPHSFGQDVIPVSMGGRRSSHFQHPGLRMLRSVEANDDENERETIPLNGSGEHQLDSSKLSDEEFQEIEMTAARGSPVRRAFEGSHRSSSAASYDSGDSDASLTYVTSPTYAGTGDNVSGVVGNMELIEMDHRIREEELPERFTRDPDFVDMPNLKSSSKVAIPAGVKRNKSFGSTSASGNTL